MVLAMSSSCSLLALIKTVGSNTGVPGAGAIVTSGIPFETTSAFDICGAGGADISGIENAADKSGDGSEGATEVADGAEVAL